MANGRFRPGLWAVAGMVLCIACFGTGCPVTIDVGSPLPSDDAPSADSVRVELRNRHATAAVDVDLFATGAAVTNVDTELFTAANEIPNIGFAGTGLIPAGDTDSVTLDCAQARFIGTTGGRFVDPDSNEELGFGQQRVLAQEVIFNCGDTITFQFERSGDGFATVVLIE